jgi:ferritin-like metal-binding protein YciE
MGLFSKDIQSLDDLFMHGLQDLYYAENQILKALPAMIDTAPDKELRAGFEKHLKETEGHVHRLRQVFELMDAEPKGDKCPAIDGILKEGKDLMGEVEGDDVMTVALVAAAQAVEHYEITRYGALIAWASELGRTDCVPHFKASLAEEKATDQKLTMMSERRFNPQADKKPAGSKAKSVARRKPAKSASRSSTKTKRAPTKKTRRRA